ncbi:Cytidylate kinase [hydrothermal vent metagenome]|uniref:(d)CMP kinase n=1 Tax=hydrothermal vent metagenome TaxID=652676 RepID=A0A3B0R4B9_9ZZZZ
MIIAIDGPAAAGKGTLARQIADHFKYHYLDTGSLYRGVGLAVIRSGGDPANEKDALAAARDLKQDDLVDCDLRTAQAGKTASIVAQIPAVRSEILQFQRRFAQQLPGAVLDGRDIGTVVCPDADIKLFVTASNQERARRRFAELVARQEPCEFDKVLADLQERDKRDRERLIAPLKPAADAHLLDTSKLDIDAAFRAALDIINSH